jgi:predicted RNA-binding Zn ribbon-like protein
MSDKFIFLAANLCLDFVNTQIMRRGEATDLLETETDFLLWLQEAQIFEDAMLEQIPEGWWADIFTEALEFRQDLRAMAESLKNTQAVPVTSIAAINHYLLSPPDYHQVEVIDEQYHSHSHYRIETVQQLLFPIAEAAREVLSERDHSRVKQCSSETCILYFYDSSKNGSRRWCSMETCGNRRKVKRHYERNQGE